MAWAVTAVVAGGAIIGGIIQGETAKHGARLQGQAADRANVVQRDQMDLQREQFEQQRADLEPWRQTGTRALSELESRTPELNRSFSMSDFQKDPGYQFRMDEANKAIERSAAARGGLGSGRTLKELSRFNSDYASSEYQNAYNRYNQDRNQVFNRYASLAGIGQAATGQGIASSQNFTSNMGNSANAIGNNYMGAGNAQAAAGIAQGNAYSNTIGQGANTWMQMQMMNRAFPTG